MKNVLFISYSFPPYSGVGSVIASQTVKYLPKFGWNPIVLTATEREYRSQVVKNYFPPDNLEIHRVASIKQPAIADGLKTRNNAALVTATSKTSISIRIKSVVRWIASFVVNPDAHFLWIPFAVYRGLKIIKRQNIKVIYARLHPASSVMVGYYLNRLTGLPLVVEFSDYWTLRGHYPWKSAVQKKIQRRQEKKVIEAATFVTTGFDDALYREFYPEYREKFKLMMLGFDEDDFKVRPFPKPEEYIISHIGKIRGEQYPMEPFLSAVKASKIPNLKVRLIGDIDDDCKKLISKLQLNNVEILGPQPHEVAVQHMLSSDVLLLLINDSKENFATNYSTKLFEYLAVKKPILALVPEDGNAAYLIRLTKSGLVSRPRNQEQIAKTLDAVYSHKWDFTIQNPELDKFNKRHIIDKLSKLLDEASCGPKK